MSKCWRSVALVLLLAAVFMTSFGCWGSPTFTLIIENQSGHDLTIYVEDYELGNVKSGEELTDTEMPWDVGRYSITASNMHGEAIYSQVYTRVQMREIESRVYKIVISPLE